MKSNSLSISKLHKKSKFPVIGICYEGMQIISYKLWKYNFEISKMQFLDILSNTEGLTVIDPVFMEIVYI